MIDINSIPSNDPNIKVYIGNAAAGSSDFQTWSKPRNCSFIYFLIIGAGGGGGGGAGGSTVTSKGGGGGGASGNVASILLPSFVVPDRLYIRVPQTSGGAGGSSANGIAGTVSVIDGIFVYPVNGTLFNSILSSAASAGTAAGGGTTVGAGGAGGTANTIIAATSLHSSAFGIFYTITGSAGAAGGASAAAGNSVRFTGTTGHCISAGAGGAGGLAGQSAGGDIIPEAMIDSSLTPFFTSSGGAVASSGNSGFKFYKTYGGTGGGSNSAGTGGNGGNCFGAIGAGDGDGAECTDDAGDDDRERHHDERLGDHGAAEPDGQHWVERSVCHPDRLHAGRWLDIEDRDRGSGVGGRDDVRGRVS